MLTKAHRVYHWDRPTNSISSDRLDDTALAHLARALAVYRRRLGDRGPDVRQAARLALRALRPDRAEAVLKLLEDAATYETPPQRLGHRLGCGCSPEPLPTTPSCGGKTPGR